MQMSICLYVCKYETALELLHVTLNCNSQMHLQGKSFKAIFNVTAFALLFKFSFMDTIVYLDASK